MDYIYWIQKRIADLRTQKGVSARDMSLSLGQSESYINKIENGRTLPSMTGFIYICEYFGLTPQEFFDTETSSPSKSKEISNEIKRLPPEYAEHILKIIQGLNQNR